MDSQDGRRRSITFLLVGLALLSMAGIIVLMVPLSTCPNCDGKGEAYGEIDGWWRELHHLPDPMPKGTYVSCSRCNKTGRLTLYQRWGDKFGR
jgi:hypothetical protein